MSATRRTTLAHRVEHAAFAGAVALSALLGERASAAFGEAIGRFGYFPLRFRRKLVEDQLHRAFPEKGDRWIRKTMRGAYAHLGREALATIRLARATQEQVIERTRMVRGFAEFQAAVRAGKGVVMVTGHVGNHEVGAAALAARGVPLDLVVQRQGNPLFDAALNEARQRLGLGIIDRFQAQRLALKSLRAGRVVGIAADQNAGKAGVFVPFFGRPASTHRGAALFAVKMNAPLFVGAAHRKGREYEIVLERVEVDRSASLDDVVYALTAAFTARLEAFVRAAPDQYLWLHRRWKTAPPEPAPEEPITPKTV